MPPTLSQIHKVDDMVANMMADMEVVNKIEGGKVTDIVAVMVANMEVDRVADIVADMVADMEVNKAADMVADVVVDMEVDKLADMLVDMDNTIHHYWSMQYHGSSTRTGQYPICWYAFLL